MFQNIFVKNSEFKYANLDIFSSVPLFFYDIKIYNKVAAGKDHIIEEVSSVMGGNVLQTEAHTILEQGEIRGKLRGAAQNLVANVESLMETMNWSLENACKALKTSVREYNNSKALIK